MGFTDFADVPVIDGHIHFPYPGLAGDVLAVMDEIGVARANLVPYQVDFDKLSFGGRMGMCLPTAGGEQCPERRNTLSV